MAEAPWSRSPRATDPQDAPPGPSPRPSIVGLVRPLTWWSESVRRARFPEIVSSVGGPGSLWPQLTGTSVPVGPTLLVLLSPSTGFDTVIAIAVYRWSEHRARERGLLDQTTGS